MLFGLVYASGRVVYAGSISVRVKARFLERSCYHALDATLLTCWSNFQDAVDATLLTCWSDVYHSVDATLLTCSCGGVGWGGAITFLLPRSWCYVANLLFKKDRENDETNVSRPAVWKDMHVFSRRDHVGANQISTLGKRGIYRVLSKHGWIWIHFFDPF